MAPHGAVSSGAALCSTGRPSWRSQLGIVGGVPRASAPPGSRYERAITLPRLSTKSGFPVVFGTLMPKSPRIWTAFFPYVPKM
jgi:hypothetical protein